jgi:hypothetical protein
MKLSPLVCASALALAALAMSAGGAFGETKATAAPVPICRYGPLKGLHIKGCPNPRQVEAAPIRRDLNLSAVPTPTPKIGGVNYNASKSNTGNIRATAPRPKPTPKH